MNSEANIFQFLCIFINTTNGLTTYIFELIFLKLENYPENVKKNQEKNVSSK